MAVMDLTDCQLSVIIQCSPHCLCSLCSIHFRLCRHS